MGRKRGGKQDGGGNNDPQQQRAAAQPQQQQQQRAPAQSQQQQQGASAQPLQQQQQRGPAHQQQQQQRGPAHQQQQQQRGPAHQQQQQRGPGQQQQGASAQPWQQQQQRGPAHQQQQQRAQDQQRRQQQQRGPGQQQQGASAQPWKQQEQRGPAQQQQRPPAQSWQQQQGPTASSLGRGRGRGRGRAPVSEGVIGLQQIPRGHPYGDGPSQLPSPQRGGIPSVEAPFQPGPHGDGPPSRQLPVISQIQQPQAPPGERSGLGHSGMVPKEPNQQASTSARRGQLKTEADKSQKPDSPAASEKSLVMQHTRRSGGTKGKRIIVESNHLGLNLGNLKIAYHYDVAIDPDRPKKILRTVMENFRSKYFPNRYPAFDGVKNLYSASELPFGKEIQGKIEIDFEEKKKEFNVTVKFANTVDLSCLTTYLNNISADGKHMVTPQEAIQCVDIVLRNASAMKCIPVGRSFFTPPSNTIFRLGNGMEMYHGFYQSAILGWKPFLNIDVAHKAFPIAGKVTEIMAEFLRNCTEGQLNQVFINPREKEDIQKHLKTLKVTYEIPNNPASKRLYRINGLADAANRAKFKPENCPEMTVEQYFLQVKKYPLRFPGLPCLWVGKRDRPSPILLPAELCTIEKNQVVNRKMNEIQTSNMIKKAATSAPIRKQKILDGFSRIQINNDPCLKEFRFSIGNEFQKIEAHVLDHPVLEYGNQQKIKPVKGVWRIDNRQFQKPAESYHWTIISCNRERSMGNLFKLADMIKKSANSLGMSLNDPIQPFKILEMQRGREQLELRKCFEAMASMSLVIVIIPDFGSYYSYVKKAAEIQVGLLTQCIKAKTLFKFNLSTATNIILKINAKLNGTNHCLSTRPACLLRPCMIMGADVTHPSPDAQEQPSFAAVTASHDPKAFKYNICWRLQPPRVEIISDLEDITVEQLMFFYKSTGCKPETIIFFRDGVSEGQFQQVVNAEVSAIRRACKKLQKDGYEPSITFIVVQKRHHTRFFPTNPRDSDDKNCNVPAGTCVDKVITHPTAQDFYLVSHASIQGVAKPTKYRTLWDDNNMSDDEIEELAFYLCHMFARCTRSVSYPAPTYYAHLAAARAKVLCENEQLDMRNLQRTQDRVKIQDQIVKGLPMFFV